MPYGISDVALAKAQALMIEASYAEAGRPAVATALEHLEAHACAAPPTSSCMRRAAHSPAASRHASGARGTA